MFNPLAHIITPRLVLRLIPEEVMAACLFARCTILNFKVKDFLTLREYGRSRFVKKIPSKQVK
jgi:hypothetical protein